MMQPHSNSRGAISLLLVVFVVALLYGGYILFIKKDSNSDATGMQEISISEAEQQNQSSDDTIHQRVISLQPVNNYNARGKVTIVEDRFSMFSLQLSAVLPSEFESTYYEAYLEGDRTVDLGRLTREGGTYKANYSSNETIDMFDKIVITVDGDAATVEGKTLPHNVMVGGLQ